MSDVLTFGTVSRLVFLMVALLAVVYLITA